MDINCTGNKNLVEISICDFITLFENEMKKLDYCQSNIHNRILMIKRACSGFPQKFDKEEIYSSEKFYSWLSMQKSKD